MRNNGWACFIGVTSCVIAGCADVRPTAPSSADVYAPKSAVSQNANSVAQINGLIRSLFPPQQQGQWMAAFAAVKDAVATGDAAAAQPLISAFVTSLLQAFPGSQPPTTAASLSQLVGMVASFGGTTAGITPEHAVLAVGSVHACILQANGEGECWGSSEYTGSGAPTAGVIQARVSVTGGVGFTSLVSNGTYTCARTTGAADLCWGRRPLLQPTRDLAPISLGNGPYLQVSPGRLVACALTPSNNAVCWGINQLGEVGDGTQIARASPVPVATALAFQTIEAAWIHSCALTFAGEAHCWGSWQGQLSFRQDVTPVAVPGGHTFTRFYTGGTHTCGVTPSSETWCWGDNAAGQLGSGVAGGWTGDPVRVAGGHSFAMIAIGTTTNNSGRSFSCGIDFGGKAWCWGQNDKGQLGDATTTDRLEPTPIISSEVFVAIDAGDRFACAMTIDRRVFCWGTNTGGELGTGVAGGFSMVPVQVP